MHLYYSAESLGGASTLLLGASIYTRRSESCVCFETSAASSFASMVESARAASAAGRSAVQLRRVDFYARLTLPPVDASAKFIRFSNADELTQVSAFIE